MIAGLGNHAIDGYVMLFSRQGRYEALSKGDGNFVALHSCKESVIKPFTIPDPVSGMVYAQRWHQDYLNGFQVRYRTMDGFSDAPFVQDEVGFRLRLPVFKRGLLGSRKINSALHRPSTPSGLSRNNMSQT